MAYYLTLSQYRYRGGRFRQLVPDDGECRIRTEPVRKNQSRAVLLHSLELACKNRSRVGRLDSCTGKTNDVDEYGHGEFDTLELAQAAAAALGYTCVADEAEAWYTHPEVVEVRRTARDSWLCYSAADYFSVTLRGLGITAESTDADLHVLEERLEAEAREDGIELYGILRILKSYREELREEA